MHRYEDELVVPDADPVVAYAASVGVELDLAGVATRIAREGAFRVAKHTVLAIGQCVRSTQTR